MAILSLQNFEATAEVLGVSRVVQFESGRGLLIKDLTLVEAKQLLEMVATDKVKAVDITASTERRDASREILNKPETETKDIEQPASEEGDAPEEKSEARSDRGGKRGRRSSKDKEKTKEEGTTRTRRTRASSKQEEQKEEDQKTETLEDELDAADTPTNGRGKKKEEEAKDWVAGHDEPGGPGHPAFDTSTIADDVVAKMGEAKSIAGIIGVLSDELQIETADQAVEICMDLKDDVPLLQKTKNLESKVRRRFETFAMSEDDNI